MMLLIGELYSQAHTLLPFSYTVRSTHAILDELSKGTPGQKLDFL